MDNKIQQKVNKPLLTLLVLTILAALSVGAFIVGDIQSGVLQGKAETGFGVLFAIILSPVLITLATLTLLRIRRLRRQGISVAKTVKLAVFLAAIVSVASLVYNVGIDKYENYAHRADHAQLQQLRDTNKNESISLKDATELLNACKLMNVDNGTNDTSNIGTELRNSREGVVLVKVDSKPYKIWVNDKAHNALKPAIDNANNNCPNFRKS